MDEYLSEKEQIEQIRQWFSDNGWYLLAGVALGLVGLFGYRQYQVSATANAEAAAIVYRQAEQAANDDNLADLERHYASLSSDYDSTPYVDHAAMLLAAELVVSDTERAASLLQSVANNSDDPHVATVAQLRWARVLAYQEQYDDAMALLEISNPGNFTARISEIRGDIHLARGQTDAARSAFTEALVATGADLLDRNYVQMKLGALVAPASSAAMESTAEILESTTTDDSGVTE